MFKTAKKNAPTVDKSETGTRNSFFFKPFIQPKLTVNQPGDEYEQEADAVADKVMSAPDHAFFFSPVSAIQRRCAGCEEEENKLQRKENLPVERDATSTENYVNTLSGGSKLDESD